VAKAANVWRGNDSTRKQDTRPSAGKRGYGRRWSAFRQRYLIGCPYCADCLKNGKRTIATDVHHIEKVTQAPHRMYDADNLMSLCRMHHQIRTNAGE
jgi:5-methylcytosine-specific restriction enzyme A